MPKKIVGKICYKTLHSRNDPCPHCPQPIALETKTTAITDYFDEAHKKFIQVSSSPIIDDGGAIVGFVNIKSDITGQKQEKDDLTKYSGHLKKMVGQLSKELQDAQVQIIEKSREKAQRQLAGRIGLELKHAIGSILKILHTYKGSSGEDGRMTKALEQATRLDQASSNLLFYSQERPPKRDEVVVSELVARILEKNLPPDSINLTLNIPFDVPYVFIDPLQVGHAVGNIVVNAVESMPEGGDLTIKAEKKAGGVSLSIMDTGPGIPPKIMKRLFEPLFTTKPSNIGVGLTVARHLIEANGGKISIDTNDTKGITVSVLLPTSEKSSIKQGVENLFK